MGSELMPQIIPSLLVFTFLVLGGWHLYWALGGEAMKSASIPSRVAARDGGEVRPAFEPGKVMTAIVGVLILAMAGLVAATSGLISLPIPRQLLAWLCFGLAAIFLLRAMGDFKYVGFFKRVKNSDFSRYDTLAYSPLCCALALGLVLVGRSSL